MIPAKGARYVMPNFDPAKHEYHGYTVLGTTNPSQAIEGMIPEVLYIGDNGILWSVPLYSWPAGLIDENPENVPKGYEVRSEVIDVCRAAKYLPKHT